MIALSGSLAAPFRWSSHEKRNLRCLVLPPLPAFRAADRRGLRFRFGVRLLALGAVMTAVNRSAWLQIAAALDKHPQRDLFDHARRVAAAEAKRAAEGAPQRGEVAVREALSQDIPDGNHGDNRTLIA